MENKHEKNEEHDFYVCDKKCQTSIFGETMANASGNNHPLNSRSKEIVYSVSEYFL